MLNRHIHKIMDAFETTLTGSDALIDGIVTPVGNQDTENPEAFQFISLDDSLHLTIARDEHGHWMRTDGTDPYFPGWVDELADKIAAAKL